MRHLRIFSYFLLASITLAGSSYAWSGELGKVKTKKLHYKDTRTIHYSADRSGTCLSPLPFSHFSNDFAISAGDNYGVASIGKNNKNNKNNKDDGTDEKPANSSEVSESKPASQGSGVSIISSTTVSQQIKAEFLKNALFHLCNEKLNGHISSSDYRASLGYIMYAAAAFIVDLESSAAQGHLKELLKPENNPLISQSRTGLEVGNIVKENIHFHEDNRRVQVNNMVVDGDTLLINNHDIRLYGIDALEIDSYEEEYYLDEFIEDCIKSDKAILACAKRSRGKLIKELMESKWISCRVVDVGNENRGVSICITDRIKPENISTGGWLENSLNAYMLMEGYATPNEFAIDEYWEIMPSASGIVKPNNT